MKKNRLKLLIAPVLVAGLTLAVAACGSSNNNSTTSSSGGSNTATPTATVPGNLPTPPATAQDETRTQFQQDVQDQIDKLEARLQDVRNGLPSLSADQKAQAQQKADDLQNQVDSLKSKLQQAQNASGPQYDQLKQQINDQLANMHTTIENLADQLGL